MFRYTRNLVDEGNGKFNVMALCWGEGHGSSVHDHSGSDCFVKVLDGQLQETLFDWPCDSDDDSKPLEEKGKVVSLLLSRSSVVLLGSNSFNSGYIFIIEML